MWTRPPRGHVECATNRTGRGLNSRLRSGATGRCGCPACPRVRRRCLPARRSPRGRRDDRDLSAGPQEAGGGAHLGTHAAFGELALGQVALGVLQRHLLRRTFQRGAVVEEDGLDAGHQHEGRGSEGGGQGGGGVVLVDHGLHAPVPVHGGDDGDAPAAGSHHHEAFAQQSPDGRGLQEPEGLGRGDDPAPAPSGILLDRPPPGCSPLLRFLGSEEGPDGLIRLEKAESAGSTSAWVTTEATSGPRGPATFGSTRVRRLAELALGHGAQGEERLGGNEVGGLFLLDGQVADLGAVAVDEHDLPAGPHERAHRAGHEGGVAFLLRVGPGLADLTQGILPRRGLRSGPSRRAPSLAPGVQDAKLRVHDSGWRWG